MDSSSTEHEGSADGPDRGDPAAPVLWGVEGITAAHPPVIRTVLTTLEEASQVAQRLGGTVVPLYRAPGAVPAAPPGDEDGTGPRRPNADPDRARALAAALRDLPASPAWHEDEAAVERAFCEVEQWEVMEPLEQPNGQWHEQTRTEVRAMLRAALAAARGPRTPDPGAGA